MTQYEVKNNTRERFLITYSPQKVRYLKELGYVYLFKCLNEKSNSPFWVFDSSPEIRASLDNYVVDTVNI